MATKRGFKDQHEMNDHIIKSWNSVVGRKDVTWILGDITMEKAVHYHMLNRLNGLKKVVLGNHDRPEHVPHLLNYVNSVCSMKYHKDKEFGNVIFTHAPIHPCELDYRFTINIHGHDHERNLKDERYINICAEFIDYKPKLLSELICR
jgi:calcineurin-like phosphoesterase family protein